MEKRCGWCGGEWLSLFLTSLTFRAGTGGEFWQPVGNKWDSNPSLLDSLLVFTTGFLEWGCSRDNLDLVALSETAGWGGWDIRASAAFSLVPETNTYALKSPRFTVIRVYLQVFRVRTYAEALEA